MGLAMVREIIWNGESPNNLRIEQVRACGSGWSGAGTWW